MVLLTLLVLPVMALGDDPQMSPSIQDVKKQHEARFLEMPGVVSVGIGLDPDGNPAIIIGVDKSNPEAESKIPSIIEGYPVVIQRVGSIKAQ
jgi:hypothetical protein